MLALSFVSIIQVVEEVNLYLNEWVSWTASPASRPCGALHLMNIPCPVAHKQRSTAPFRYYQEYPLIKGHELEVRESSPPCPSHFANLFMHGVKLAPIYWSPISSVYLLAGIATMNSTILSELHTQGREAVELSLCIWFSLSDYLTAQGTSDTVPLYGKFWSACSCFISFLCAVVRSLGAKKKKKKTERRWYILLARAHDSCRYTVQYLVGDLFQTIKKTCHVFYVIWVFSSDTRKEAPESSMRPHGDVIQYRYRSKNSAVPPTEPCLREWKQLHKIYFQ